MMIGNPVFIIANDAANMLTVEHILVRGDVETQDSYVAGNGAIGRTYTMAPLDPLPDGYVFDYATVNEIVYDPDNGNPSGELGEDGLRFKFYYKYNKFHVYYQSTGQAVDYDMADTFNAASQVHTGYLYGGLYQDETFSQPLADNTCGMSITPVADMTYYVKEVSEDYLRPKIFYYNNSTSKVVTMVAMVTAVDGTNYQRAGFLVSDSDVEDQIIEGNNVLTEIKQYTEDGTLKADYTVASFFPGLSESSLLQTFQYSGEIEANGSFNFVPCYVTPDGVRVTGTAVRTVNFGDGTIIPPGGMSVSDTASPSQVEAYSGGPSSDRLVIQDDSDGEGA